MTPTRRMAIVLFGVLSLLASLAAAQEEQTSDVERISPYMRISQWRGVFIDRLIRSEPPRGKQWIQAGKVGGTWQVMAPAGMPLDTKQSGSRLMRVALREDKTPPRPVFSLYVFGRGADEPTELTAEIAKAYVERYRAAGIDKSTLTVTDQALIARGKMRFALVAGTYNKAGSEMRHIHFAYYDERRQFYLNFDCALAEWPKHQDTIGQIFLSFRPEGPRK